MNRTILKTLIQVTDYFSIRSEVYSFDWETTGLDYLKMEPVGVSFCDGQRTTYIDLFENAEADEIMDFLGPVFERGRFIGHNLKFDIKCTRKFCHNEPKDIFCTYIASFLLNENRPTHGLKVLAIEDLHIPKEEISGWNKAKDSGYSSDTWYHYCYNDAEWAYALYRLYSGMLSRDGLEHLFYNVEMPFQFVLADLEINGVKIDQESLKDLEFRTRNKINEIEDRMFNSVSLRVVLQQRMFGLADERVPPKNLRSGAQLKKILKKLGFLVKDTKKQTIEGLKGKHPFIDYLIQYKKLRKLYDAYIIPAFGLVDVDGRIRPDYGIVKTGRLSCRNPNLQQLPNISKLFPELNYRSIFIAERDRKLVGGDYSGQEFRVLGEVSEDDTIRRSFMEGKDLHMVTANYIFDLCLDNLALVENSELYNKAKNDYKMERYQAKNGVNYPIIFGSSEYGIARNMGVDVATAKEWQKKFFELYPKVKEAMNVTLHEIEETGFVSTFMGRRRRFPQYQNLPKWSKGKSPSKSRCVRQGFNFKIQGFSADQVKIAAAMARKAGLKIILMVHDEIVIESSNPEVDAVLLKQIMENAISLSIPFIANVKIGERYFELK